MDPKRILRLHEPRAMQTRNKYKSNFTTQSKHINIVNTIIRGHDFLKNTIHMFSYLLMCSQLRLVV